MHRRLFLLAPAALALAGCETINAAIGQGASGESPVVVFFTEDSAALAAPAEELVRGAAATAARHPGTTVRVLGFAGPAGGLAFNRALSEARARHVGDHLVQAGLDRSRLRIVTRGPVPVEMLATEARRVEIRFGE